MSLETGTGKDRLRKAFSVKSKETSEIEEQAEETAVSGASTKSIGITLSRKEKTPMATLTIRYPIDYEKRLEKIARFSGLNKTEVVMSIFNQTFPDLERQLGFK